MPENVLLNQKGAFLLIKVMSGSSLSTVFPKTPTFMSPNPCIRRRKTKPVQLSIIPMNLIGTKFSRPTCLPLEWLFWIVWSFKKAKALYFQHFPKKSIACGGSLMISTVDNYDPLLPLCWAKIIKKGPIHMIWWSWLKLISRSLLDFLFLFFLLIL